MRSSIDLMKPLIDFIHSLLHRFKIGTENDIFPCSLCHMLIKNHIEIVRHIKCSAESFKVFFSLVFNSLITGIPDSYLIFCKAFLIRKYRQDILRRIEDSTNDSFAQSHFTCYITVKKLISHIALIVKIANSSCRQTEDMNVHIHRQQAVNALTLLLRTTAMKFIENDVIGSDFRQLVLVHVHQTGVSEILYIFRDIATRSRFEVLYLCFEYIKASIYFYRDYPRTA